MKEFEFTVFKGGVPVCIKLEVAEDHVVINGKHLTLVGDDYLLEGKVVMTRSNVLEMVSALEGVG